MNFASAAGIATIAIAEHEWTILEATMYQPGPLDEATHAKLTIIGNSLPDIGEQVAYITVDNRPIIRRICITSVEPKPNSMQVVIKLAYKDID